MVIGGGDSEACTQRYQITDENGIQGERIGVVAAYINLETNKTLMFANLLCEKICSGDCTGRQITANRYDPTYPSVRATLDHQVQVYEEGEPCSGYDWSQPETAGTYINPSWGVAQGRDVSGGNCGETYLILREQGEPRYVVIRGYKNSDTDFHIPFGVNDCDELCGEESMCSERKVEGDCKVDIVPYYASVTVFEPPTDGNPPVLAGIQSVACPNFDWASPVYEGTIHLPSWSVGRTTNVCGNVYSLITSDILENDFFYSVVAAYTPDTNEDGVSDLSIGVDLCTGLCGYCQAGSIPIGCSVTYHLHNKIELVGTTIAEHPHPPFVADPDFSGYTYFCPGYDDWLDATYEGTYVDPSWGVIYGNYAETRCGETFLSLTPEGTPKYVIIRAYRTEPHVLRIGISYEECREYCQTFCNEGVDCYMWGLSIFDDVTTFLIPNATIPESPIIGDIVSTPCDGIGWKTPIYNGTAKNPSWAVAYLPSKLGFLKSPCGTVHNFKEISKPDTVLQFIIRAEIDIGDSITDTFSYKVAIDKESCEALCGKDCVAGLLPDGCVIVPQEVSLAHREKVKNINAETQSEHIVHNTARQIATGKNIMTFHTPTPPNPPTVGNNLSVACKTYDWSSPSYEGIKSNNSWIVSLYGKADCNEPKMIVNAETKSVHYTVVGAYIDWKIDNMLGLSDTDCGSFCGTECTPPESSCTLVGSVFYPSHVSVYGVEFEKPFAYENATACEGYEDSWNMHDTVGTYINPGWAVATGRGATAERCGETFALYRADFLPGPNYVVIRAYHYFNNWFNIDTGTENCNFQCGEDDVCNINGIQFGCDTDSVQYFGEITVFDAPTDARPPVLAGIQSLTCPGFSWTSPVYEGTIDLPSWSVGRLDEECQKIYPVVNLDDHQEYFVIAAYTPNTIVDDISTVSLASQRCLTMCGYSCDAGPSPFYCILSFSL